MGPKHVQCVPAVVCHLRHIQWLAPTSLSPVTTRADRPSYANKNKRPLEESVSSRESRTAIYVLCSTCSFTQDPNRFSGSLESYVRINDTRRYIWLPSLQDAHSI
jgi:hypothetical protein